MIDFVSVRDASKECGVSEYCLRNWIKRGECPGYYSGTRFYVDVKKLEQMIRLGAYDNK